MLDQNHNLELLKEIKTDELVNDFMTYWTIRKSPHAIAANKIEEIKNKNENDWLRLIESNHKFRNTYGEEMALELISAIEEKTLSK